MTTDRETLVVDDQGVVIGAVTKVYPPSELGRRHPLFIVWAVDWEGDFPEVTPANERNVLVVSVDDDPDSSLAEIRKRAEESRLTLVAWGAHIEELHGYALAEYQAWKAGDQ